MTTYDPWRSAKRLHDLIYFVRWHNCTFDSKIELLILGYNQSACPASLTREDREWIQAEDGVRTIPTYTDYTPEIEAEISRQHLYMTFSFRDNCPNAVIEAMSYGLPVVGLDSGGLPEIVGDAGEIVPLNQLGDYFCAYDRSFDYPDFDALAVAASIRKVMANYANYCANVERRFRDELGLDHVASKYLEFLTPKICAMPKRNEKPQVQIDFHLSKTQL